MSYITQDYATRVLPLPLLCVLFFLIYRARIVPIVIPESGNSYNEKSVQP
jgi:hypothetical protein